MVVRGNRGQSRRSKGEFPIGDDDSARRTVPPVTYALLALNVLLVLAELSGSDAFVATWALVPSRVLADPGGDLATLLTSMFMHAGFLLTFVFRGSRGASATSSVARNEYGEW